MQPRNAVGLSEFFLVLRADGTAETVELGGEKSLCVFSGVAAIRPFHIARYGGDFATRDVGTLHYPDPAQFLEFLQSHQQALAGQGVRHLALDPAPNGAIRRVTIQEFINSFGPPA